VAGLAGAQMPGVRRRGRWSADTVTVRDSKRCATFSDDVLTARSFAQPPETVRANQELLALGAANMGASLLHGFPVSSSASRTAIAVATGSRSQVYSVAAAGSVLVAVFFLRPVLARFPDAALGAIVIYAAIRLIDVTAFRRLPRVPPGRTGGRTVRVRRRPRAEHPVWRAAGGEHIRR
jgi:Sulfate permease family